MICLDNRATAERVRRPPTPTSHLESSQIHLIYFSFEKEPEDYV